MNVVFTLERIPTDVSRAIYMMRFYLLEEEKMMSPIIIKDKQRDIIYTLYIYILTKEEEHPHL